MNALSLAPPVKFDAKPEAGLFRGLIINEDGALGARTHHLYASARGALEACDRLWRKLRAQAAEVDL